MANVLVTDGLFEVDDAGVRLLCGRCGDCGTDFFPRADTCPYCASQDVAETVEDGDGATLWAWTSVQAAPPGYDGPVPYGFGVVELAGGLRVVTRLTEADPGRLEYGMPMRLTSVEVGTDEDGAALVMYAFAPEEAAA